MDIIDSIMKRLNISSVVVQLRMTLWRKVINHILGCVVEKNNDTDLLHPAFTTNSKPAAVVGKNIFPCGELMQIAKSA